MASVSGLLLTDPVDASVWRYDIAPTDEGRAFRTKTVPWEDSMPTTPWVKNLFPFDAGASRTKDTNKRGLQLAAQNPTDTGGGTALVATKDISNTPLLDQPLQSLHDVSQT